MTNVARLADMAAPQGADPITIRVDDLDSTTRALAEQVLPALARREVYQRAGNLVHVVREPVNDVGGIARAIGSPHIRGLPKQLLINELSEAADWVKTVHSKGGRSDDEAVKPPDDVVRTIIEAGQWERVRPLRAIANWPTLRPDGGIAMVDGYDPGSRYLLCDVPVIALPEAPTQSDARAAAVELLDLISDFPVETEAGRAAWLAGVLTLIARPAIRGPIPCILFNAPTAGSGKTLLAQLTAMLVTGTTTAARAAPQDSSEWNRSLLSIVLGGDAVCLFDNLKGKVESGALEAVLTTAKFKERRLRTNDEVVADVETLFLLTGNNAEFTVDLARRALECRLVPESERPETRGGFKIPRLEAFVIHHRPRLLRAALTIFHAYNLANRPPVSMRHMGSFEAWSDSVRAPMIWAGCADPGATQDALREESASGELDGRRELLEAWHECFASRPVTVKAALFEKKSPRLVQALTELCDVEKFEDVSSRVLGARLKSMKDRVLGSLALRKVAGNNSAGVVWQVVSLAAKPN